MKESDANRCPGGCSTTMHLSAMAITLPERVSSYSLLTFSFFAIEIYTTSSLPATTIILNLLPNNYSSL